MERTLTLKDDETGVVKVSGCGRWVWLRGNFKGRRYESGIVGEIWFLLLNGG